MATANWVRLDVGYFRNPKVIAAGRDAVLVHLAAICWAGEVESDGHIPAAVMPTLLLAAGVTSRRVVPTLNAAIDAGLLVPNGDGFVVHDFDVMNGSQSPAFRSRELWRARQRRYRENHNNNGDVS